MVYSVPFQCFHLISFNYRALIFGLYFFGVVSYPLPQEERGGVWDGLRYYVQSKRTENVVIEHYEFTLHF